MSAFTVTTKNITEHKAVLDRQKFIQLLREAGHNVPDDAKIMMEVPLGGDYSGMTLDINDMPINVEYTTIES